MDKQHGAVASTDQFGQDPERAANAILTAELESVQADALRYRWLRDVGASTWISFQEQWRMPAARCDAAIDAAMGAKT